MELKLTKSPVDQREWQRREMESLRNALTKETYEQNGALYWTTNGAPVPMHTFKDACAEPPVAQQAAVDENTARVIREYRAACDERTPAQIAEQRASARAAFGPGVELVDVFTGERYRT